MESGVWYLSFSKKKIAFGKYPSQKNKKSSRKSKKLKKDE